MSIPYSNIGVFITFVGFLLTLFEYIRPYKGHEYNDQRDPFVHGFDPAVDGGFRTETKEYRLWKGRKRALILTGVVTTAIGIYLQVAY